MISFGFDQEIFSLFSHPVLLAAAGAGASWILLFRPRLKMIPMGFLAFMGAVILEYYALPFGYGVELLFLAPTIEESLKFAANRSKSLRGGMGAGTGFSVLENATYFVIFLGSPYFVIEAAVRSLSDVMMHSFNSGLSSFSYRRGAKLRFGLPLAILVHGAFNFGTLLFGSSGIREVLFLGAVFLLMLIGILRLSKMNRPQLRRSGEISAEISDKIRT